MAVEILAAGTGVANSTTVTVTAAAPVTVSLGHTSGIVPFITSSVIQGSPPEKLLLQIQSPTGWMAFDEMDSITPNIRIEAPGVYRVRRASINESISAFRSDP